MADRVTGLLMAAWRTVDIRLASLARSLQRMLGMLRVMRTLLVVGIIAMLASAVVATLAAAGLVEARWVYASYALATIFSVIPLGACFVLVSLPLRARSVTRLIDKGYPENAKELAIRLIARKLHEESIATEELLVDTAINEGRKYVRRARQQGADAATDPSGAAPPPPPRQDP